MSEDSAAIRSARRRLTRQQKAAVIIGVLGAETAGPVLEQFDETSLRNFTRAMSGLKRIDAHRLVVAWVD